MNAMVITSMNTGIKTPKDLILLLCPSGYQLKHDGRTCEGVKVMQYIHSIAIIM